MIFEFEKYIINERLGISNDLVYLSEKIYDILNKDNSDKITINGNDLKTEKIIIDKIIIKRLETKDIGQLDINKSKLSEEGVILNIYFNKNKNVDKNTIYHEISHCIDFYFKGKDKMIENLFDLKLSHIANNRFKGKLVYVNEFIHALYMSNESEINSLISETFIDIYSFIKNNIKDFNDHMEIKKLFEKQLYESFLYRQIIFLRQYNIKDLKKLDHNDLIKFFNIMYNNKLDLIKYKNYNFLDRIKMTINAIVDIWFDRFEYYHSFKKYKKVDEIEHLFNHYDIQFKKASDNLKRKSGKLLPLIIEKLKK